jgi:hypothetical protein
VLEGITPLLGLGVTVSTKLSLSLQSFLNVPCSSSTTCSSLEPIQYLGGRTCFDYSYHSQFGYKKSLVDYHISPNNGDKTSYHITLWHPTPLYRFFAAMWLVVHYLLPLTRQQVLTAWGLCFFIADMFVMYKANTFWVRYVACGLRCSIFLNYHTRFLNRLGVNWKQQGVNKSNERCENQNPNFLLPP